MDLYMPSMQTIVAALIPGILGMLWFHSNVFGNAWMKGANLTPPTDEDKKKMPMLMGIGFVLALVIASFLKSYAIFHEGQPDANFLHGCFHGVILCAMLALPTMISASIWEKKSLNYYLIQAAYWLLAFALMGGVIFAWRSGYAEIAKSIGMGG
jgi:hypothetical protein